MAQTQFMDIFSDIIIRKSNDKSLRVSCVFGQRSRIFKDLQNPDKGAIVTPLIIITRTGLSRDTERVSDVNEMLKKVTSTYDYNDWIPNPMNMEFQVTVVSKLQSDIERIICNFIPFFNPDVYVRTTHPKLPDNKMNLQIHWAGDIDEEWPEEIEPSDYDYKVATTNFTMKTAIFGGLENEINARTGLIHDIRFILTDTLSGETGYPNSMVGGWYDVPTMYEFDDYYRDLGDGTITPNYDTMIISGQSPIQP